ncbi:hypothetical protein M758_7G080800 [Ceratodon purpureus]|nr:hypothetical protein M758_7G080800 [Ceratodon purpureus]
MLKHTIHTISRLLSSECKFAVDDPSFGNCFVCGLPSIVWRVTELVSDGCCSALVTRWRALCSDLTVGTISLSAFGAIEEVM